MSISEHYNRNIIPYIIFYFFINQAYRRAIIIATIFIKLFRSAPLFPFHINFSVSDNCDFHSYKPPFRFAKATDGVMKILFSNFSALHFFNSTLMLFFLFIIINSNQQYFPLIIFQCLHILLFFHLRNCTFC